MSYPPDTHWIYVLYTLQEKTGNLIETCPPEGKTLIKRIGEVHFSRSVKCEYPDAQYMHRPNGPEYKKAKEMLWALFQQHFPGRRPVPPE